MSLKSALRIAALGAALVSMIGWLCLGTNRGWTKTSVRVEQTDPVTEQVYYVWQDRFVPGVDLLAVCLAGALGLYAASFLVPKPKTGQFKS
jgi:hypothetical protein